MTPAFFICGWSAASCLRGAGAGVSLFKEARSKLPQPADTRMFHGDAAMICTNFRNNLRNNLRKGLRTVLIACPLSAGLAFASGAAFAAAQPAHGHGSPVQLADAHGSRPLPVYG
ncbi:MAG TPA: hypothetical protein PKW88_12020, partial [Plasticicumulans sp.]|nr:hypothetical protein [Plasticicumulans sp.]